MRIRSVGLGLIDWGLCRRFAIIVVRNSAESIDPNDWIFRVVPT